jgi:hypothetical protein
MDPAVASCPSARSWSTGSVDRLQARHTGRGRRMSTPNELHHPPVPRGHLTECRCAFRSERPQSRCWACPLRTSTERASRTEARARSLRKSGSARTLGFTRVSTMPECRNHAKAEAGLARRRLLSAWNWEAPVGGAAACAGRRLRKGGLSGSGPSVPHALPRSCLLTGFDLAARLALLLVVQTRRPNGRHLDAHTRAESGRVASCLPRLASLVCAGYRCVLDDESELAEASTGVEMGPLTLTPCEAISLRSSCCDCPLRFVDESSGDPSHLVSAAFAGAGRGL